MKKPVNLLALMLVMILSQACETDDKEPLKENNSLSLNEKMLSFENVHSYSDLFDNYNEQKFNSLIKSSSFTSFRKAKASNPSASKMISFIDKEEMDLRIYDLINDQGFIGLGKYIVRLDLITKTVFVSENSDQNTLTLMSDSKNNNSDIFSFPFDYNVTELLELCEENNTTLAEGIHLYETNGGDISKAACRGASGRNDAKEKCGDNRYDYNGKAYSSKVKLEYEKFGIYFSIKAKVKNYKVNSVCNPHKSGSQSIRYTRCDINKKKKKCKWFKCECKDDWQYDWSRSGVTITEGSGYDENSDRYVTTHQAYEKSRGLQAYAVSVVVTYGPTLGATGAQSKTLSIKSNL